MNNILEKLYKRYNQHCEYYSAYTVKNPYTMIRILKDSKKQRIDIDKQIKEYEIDKLLEKNKNFQELIIDSENIQPKSIFIRVYYLKLIASAIPESFFQRMNINGSTIVEMSLAITLYYLGLQTYRFSEVEITGTEKNNLFGRVDFYIGLSDIQKVRGKSTSEEFETFINLFAKNIYEIKEEDKMGLFLDGGELFIICINEFLDYMIFKLENIFKENHLDKENSYYTDKRGYAFEEMVYGITKNFVQESYHTLFYYPNNKQEIEIDILLKDSENLVVLECKSGSFDASGVDQDEFLKLQIHNKTKKAYKSLKKVSEYLLNSNEYRFECNEKTITGYVKNPICIHVSMYPMDFISSNVHTLFPEYLEGVDSPILTISLEHLFAMMFDAKISKKDIFKYWKQRKQDIAEHPGIHFDNNELDLYYEIINEDKNTMLTEIKRQGIIDQINPNGRIISSFHNEFGDETRPAAKMLFMLDQYLLLGIFKNGKMGFAINKRYLRNLESFLNKE
ncbi:hypothetical protein [Lacrimispora sp.]|uniref:hypothetical protein n=1 Tax=Lacrimispora sp. TaxID=2719234 RepID=UPI0028AE40C9|nr:hypothetical protein [Lacrimispora sp.]